jgi:prepilin-type N-terminal cleavage/methylation domain-containing protein
VITITGTPGNGSNNCNISQPNISYRFFDTDIAIKFKELLHSSFYSSHWVYIPPTLPMVRHSNGNLGFTLVEMVTVVFITGVLAAIGVQSMAKSSSFSNTVVKVESGLRVTSLKARANAGIPYRVTLQIDPNTGEQFLKTQHLVNSNCNAATTALWRDDPTQDIYVPKRIVIPTVANISNPNIKPFPGFCFDGRGNVVSLNGSSRIFSVLDSKPGEKAVLANISISAIGDLTHETYKSNGAPLYGKFD